MSELDVLKDLCDVRLAERGLNEDPRYLKRLHWEMGEIAAQDEAEYFLDLHKKGIKYPQNQNNLLVVYLLDICDDFDIDKDPECVFGEYPDIDVDYLKTVRDYLKNVWAVKWAAEEFGPGTVCNIGNYSTFGIKSAFLDMATAYGENRHEINAITTKLGLKDDEGKGLTFEKALELYPDLNEYSKRYPHIAKAVKKMLHRNRGMGKHAGGLIISKSRIDDLVPLVRNVKDDTITSAWVEGLHGQDLGPVGLIKFDLLVIHDLERIVTISRLIKQRHGMKGISAKASTPDWDWSDGSYRNDPKLIEMANRGELLGVFQFDSDGIRKLVRQGGVTDFRDIVAYSALYRPGPLNMGMHERYIERKHGREKYTVHPVLEPYLGYTYGIMCFQEQVMQVLHYAGDVPLKDCYAVVKAIAKKKVSGFAKYKEKFLRVAKERLGLNDEGVQHWWGQIESFAEYGFNRSHSCAYSYISARLLYMKANFPMEFWAGTLACEEDTDTINLYRRQAMNAGMNICPVNVNKSRETFSIGDDGNIYMGFGNIKGVGQNPAARIVAAREEGGDFKGIEDFLARFGTDASILRALIGLRVFKEYDPITLAKFVDYFKETNNKRKQRRERYRKSEINYMEKLVALMPEELPKLRAKAAFTPSFMAFCEKFMNKDEEKEIEYEEEYETGATEEVERVIHRPKDPSIDIAHVDLDAIDPDMMESVVVKETVPVKAFRTAKKMKKFNRWKEIKKLWNLQQRSVKQFHERNAEEDQNPILLSTFNPADVVLDPKHVKILKSKRDCEVEYLGFEWETSIERSPDFDPNNPMTYEVCETLAHQGVKVMYLQGEIAEVQSRKSKAKGTVYHALVLIDASGRVGYINVWGGEWEKFKSFLKKGNLVRLIVRPPTNNFKSYSVWSPPRDRPNEGEKRGIIPVVKLDHGEDHDLMPENEFEKQMLDLAGEA